MNRQIAIVVFLSLALIFGIVQVWPIYQDLKILEQRNEEKRKEIQKREEYIQDLKKAADELKNYQTQLSKIDTALPFGSQLPVLFDFLQKTSAQSGLILKDIKASAPRVVAKGGEEGIFPSASQTITEGGEEVSSTTTTSQPSLNMKETELSLTVSGVYSSFKSFLSVLEKNIRLFEAGSISFSSGEKEGPEEFNLRIKVYSY